MSDGWDDWVGEVVRPKCFWVLGWYSEGRANLSSWMGDEPVRYAVALGVKPGDSVMLSNLKSGTRLLLCRDREQAIEKARELGGIAVLGWFDEKRARKGKLP
jgi:hypothetical protein